MSTLVIIPCGKAKVWDKEPRLGAVAAKNAYTGSPFKVNREYAEAVGDRWVILSARYGFVEPDYRLPGNYDVTFKKPGPDLVAPQVLREQIDSLGLAAFDSIEVLGGVGYRVAVQGAFDGLTPRLLFPFAGLPIGRGMQAIKQAIAAKGRS